MLMLKTIEDLIFSEPFKLGLEKAIKISNDKQFETLFEIKKKLKGDGFNFPNKILVGDKYCVGISAFGIAGLSRIVREYGQKYDVDVSNYRLKEMAKDKRFLDFADKLSINDEGIAVSYPKFPGVISNNSGYKILHAHTHPSYIAIPSEADLSVLKRIGYRSPISPIGMVIASEPINKNHEIIMFQEKTKKDILDKYEPNIEEFKNYSNGNQSNSEEYYKCLLAYNGKQRILGILKGSIKEFKII